MREQIRTFSVLNFLPSSRNQASLLSLYNHSLQLLNQIVLILERFRPD